MTRSMVLQSIAISPRTTTSAAPCCGYPRIDRLRASGWGAPRARWPDTGRPPLRRWCLRSVSRASSHGRLGGSPSALDLFWLSAGDISQGFCVGCGARWWVFPFPLSRTGRAAFITALSFCVAATALLPAHWRRHDGATAVNARGNRLAGQTGGVFAKLHRAGPFAVADQALVVADVPRYPVAPLPHHDARLDGINDPRRVEGFAAILAPADAVAIQVLADGHVVPGKDGSRLVDRRCLTGHWPPPRLVKMTQLIARCGRPSGHASGAPDH